MNILLVFYSVTVYKCFLFLTNAQVSRVTRNMASNKPIAITAKKVEENIDTLCPQVGT